MSRHLSPLLQILLLFVFSIFCVLCYRTWLAPEYCGTTNFTCGTVGPQETVPAYLEAEYEQGKTIFRNNCAACHAGDMRSYLTGPPLGGSEERWAEHGGKEALYAFIRNSQEMINAGTNTRANQLWEEWAPTVMNSFLNLTDEDLNALTIYIDEVYTYYSSGQDP